MALKTALIGLGRMGAQPSSRVEGKIPSGWLPITHAEAIQSTEGLDLVALCDRDELFTQKYGEYYKVKKVYNDYKELIINEKPDILSIATRTDIRRDIIHFAVQNGVKGIYAEKPLARSLAECYDILDQLHGNDVKLVYGATRRAMNVYKKAKEICWSGVIGDVKQINMEFGRSALMWSHPHSVDLITFFANSCELQSIQAACTPEDFLIPSNVVDCDPLVENAFFKFKNDVSATITQTKGLNVRIGCSKGNLTIHGNGYSLEINREKVMPDYFHSIEEIFVEDTKSGTQHLFEDLRDAIVFNRPVQNISLPEILCGHKMLFGIIESHLQGGITVEPNNIRKELTVTGKTKGMVA